MNSSADRIEIMNREQWRAWLAEHHARPESVVLIVHKRSGGERFVPHEALVEEALCFGWIDGTRRTYDDHRILQLFAPRRPSSSWSRVNKERVDRLIDEGKMTAAGMAVIDRAKRDGSWTRFDDAENLIIPDDLRVAFDRHPGSGKNFSEFPPSSRKMILHWIIEAKRPETRGKRIEEAASKAARNERAHHPKR